MFKSAVIGLLLTMSAPVEFNTDLEWVWPDPYEARVAPPANPMPKWLSKIGIDLRWVATATPARPFGAELTSITMAGGRGELVIDIAYPAFMEMWTKHMEART